MINNLRMALVLVVSAVIAISANGALQHQSWVSGVGDDVNPCTRTAPCKTFAGAITKTAAGGEISVLDPGGFSSVTITKSITINGAGEHASILASGTNGIVINAGMSDVVKLVHLQINGAGSIPSLVGIRFNTGAALIIDDVLVHGFDTGIAAYSGKTTVSHSTISNNQSFGVNVLGGTLLLEDSTLEGNNVGGQAAASAILRLSNTGIYNSMTGLGCGGGTLVTAGNNHRAGNSGGKDPVCAPTAAITIY